MRYVRLGFLTGFAVCLAYNQAFADEGAWIAARMQEMTRQQKIGQLVMTSVEGAAFEEHMRAFMSEGHFGAVILFSENLKSQDQTRILAAELQRIAVSGTGIPLFVAVDQEGGQVDRLGRLLELPPTQITAQQIGTYYRRSPEQLSKAYATYANRLAHKMRWLGINMNLAPVLDVATKNSVVSNRSFGSNPKVVTSVSRLFIQSMNDAGIIPTGKHFPGLGETTVDSHYELPVLESQRARLYARDWLPFRKLSGQLGAVMVGHVLVPDIDKKMPASLSNRVVRQLRRSIGYKGLILTDDLKMHAISKQMSIEEASVRALAAGCDMVLIGDKMASVRSALRAIDLAVVDGRLPERRINSALRRVLQTKYRYLKEPDFRLASDQE